MKYILLLLLSFNLQAQLLISPFDAMKLSFDNQDKIEKQNILLTSDEAKNVEKKAQSKLKTKIYKIFKASKEGQVLGYGILVLHKVRSKDAAILSIISPEGVLKSIEIIAFNEAMEWLPPQSWTQVLQNKKLTPRLKLGKDVPSITSATLSARSAVHAARIALSIFELKFAK